MLNSKACALQGTKLGAGLGVSNISNLLSAAPASAQAIIAYQILRGSVTASQFTPGASFQTSAIEKNIVEADQTLDVNVTSTGQVRP